MKTCSICGTKNFDVETLCTKCKNPLDDKDLVVETVVDKSEENVIYKVVSKRSEISGIAKAAKVFWIISIVYTAITVLSCLALWLTSMIVSSFEGTAFIFALVYCVCFIVGMFALLFRFLMYRHYWNKKSEGKSVGVGFKIVVLLFIDLITGILLLCDD